MSKNHICQTSDWTVYDNVQVVPFVADRSDDKKSYCPQMDAYLKRFF